MLTFTPQIGRKLAISVQQLTAPTQPPTAEGIIALFRALGCVQIDPIRAVERTQYLVLWSRLGAYSRELLSSLQFEQKQLWEYWAHAASIVLSDHYPIHQHQMRRFAHSESRWGSTARRWLAENDAFRRYIIEEIGRKGLVTSEELEDRSLGPAWESSGWTNGRNVGQMLDILWTLGEITVAKRQGLRRHWALSAEFHPEWQHHPPLSDREVTRRAVPISLNALGVATEREIKNHFVRGFYPELRSVLAELEAEGKIVPCRVEGWSNERRWVMAEQLPRLAALQAGEWQPRTTLLSPFDNLICDRKRTKAMWGFDFTIEIYVPAAKRRYGYYVLPILHGDQLIGRISPRMDHKSGVLTIENVYAEPSAPQSAEMTHALTQSITDLAQWLSAHDIQLLANQTPWKLPF